ncbi:hypothetical protein JCM10213_001839 [Rhodosporidiobolus nylandii]
MPASPLPPPHLPARRGFPQLPTSSASAHPRPSSSATHAQRPRPRPPQLTGRWLPDLPTPGGKGRGCGHFVFGSPTPSPRIAAFDLDGTVIRPLGGRSFPENSRDWEFCGPEVTRRLREAYKQGYALLLISNQASPTPKLSRDFRTKLPFVCRKIGVPLRALAAWEFDGYRKPGTGMWDAFVREFNGNVAVDYANSFYVGDAAGRTGDHADTDRKFALNNSLPFLTPEEFFLSEPPDGKWTLWGWNPAAWDHSQPDSPPLVAQNDPAAAARVGTYAGPEVVLLVGPPGTGKTSWAVRELGAEWETISHTSPRLPAAALDALRASLSTYFSSLALSSPSSPPPPKLLLDCSFPSRLSRRAVLSLLREHFSAAALPPLAPPVRTACVVFEAPSELGKHQAVYRASYEGEQLTEAGSWKRWEREWQAPMLDEGFHLLHPVHFRHTAFTHPSLYPSPAAAEEALGRWNRFLADVYPGKAWKTGVVAQRGPGWSAEESERVGKEAE